MIFAQRLGYRPATQTFVAGPEWKQFTMTSRVLRPGRQRHHGIRLGCRTKTGGFALTLDDIRLQ